MKKDEITAVGAIFTLGIVLFMYFQQQSYIKRLTTITLETQHIAIDAIEANKQANFHIERLQNQLADSYESINYYQTLVNIKEELKDYSTEEIALGLALSWTESSWRYEVNHNSSAEGICGVIPYYWEEYLLNLDVEVNSVAACIEIYKFLKQDRTDNQAMRKYKGIQSDKYHYLVPYTFEIRDLILKKLQ